MIKMPFITVNNFLYDNQCTDIIDSLERHLHSVGKEQGRATVLSNNKSELQENVRSTQLCFLHTDTLLSTIYFHAAKHMNELCKWNFDIERVESIQVLKYEVGDFYVTHIDVLPPTERNTQRKITVMVWLTDPEEYEGGEFILYPLDTDPITLKLRKGCAVIFPSFITHEASKVISGQRYSTTAWIEGPNWK
jgi:PKHD-type hydroxylase